MKFTKYIFLINIFLLTVVPSVWAQLNEDFEGNFPPPGWAVFDNGVGLNNSWEKALIISNSGEGHAYVRQSVTLDGVDIAEDWLVTPRLQPDVNNNTLTFFATDAFTTNYGSIYTIRVSTISQFDPNTFTTVTTYLESQFTADVYQQFTVDLSAFEGQDIYVAFVMENNRGDSFLLDDVVGPNVAPSNTLPSCDAILQQPISGAIDIPVETNLVWSAASGDPFGYKLQIGTTEGGSEFLAQTDVGAALIYEPSMDFAYNTTYYVSILPYNTLGDAIPELCGVLSFTTREDPNISLDCGGAGTPINKTLCYTDNENLAFTITSLDASQVELLFNAGTLEDGQDRIFIYDGTDALGTLLNPNLLSGNAGDLTGINYVSSTGSLYVELESDNSNSCGDGNQTAISYTASCAACVPAVGVATVGTCDNVNSEFFIDVNISSLGSSTVTILNDQGVGSTSVNMTGTTTVGPFDFGTVTLTLQNDADNQCNINLPSITLEGCSPDNDDCMSATVAPYILSASTDNTCDNAVSGTLAFATDAAVDGLCIEENLDVWYSFSPGTTEDYIFNVTSVVASPFIAIYEGDCTNGLTLVNLDCINEGYARLNLTQGTTYLIQVSSDDPEFSTDFDLCVYAAPPPPTNDLCDNATELTEDLMDVDITFSTNTDGLNCNGTPTGSGVWYQFTGVNGSIDIAVQPGDWDAELQLWSGADCQNLTCELRVDDGITGEAESITEFATTPELNYFLYVSAFSDSELPGFFDITFSSFVLSLDLLRFEGTANDKTNTLTWITSNETNIQTHTIERSLDGQNNWIKIGSVAARNQANQQYSLIDENPLKTGYYRLVSLDDTGKAAFSEIISIERKDQGGVQVFPVPTTDSVTVQYYAASEDNFSLSISDLTGRIIRVQQIKVVEGINQTQIPLTDLTNGIYTLTVDNNIAPINTRIVKK